MDGRALLEKLEKKLLRGSDQKSLKQAEIARLLGVTQPAIAQLKSRQDITAAQVANLVHNARLAGQREPIRPVVEFFPFDPSDSRQGKSKELFPLKAASRYHEGLRKELERLHGVYVFYDSRGRALYAGKALKQFLWQEIKNALNRNRDVQTIMRVEHPGERYRFRNGDDKRRRIKRQKLPLSDLARYISAYSVPLGLINTAETMLIRAFPNDLLNSRMETFGALKRKPHRRATRMRARNGR